MAAEWINRRKLHEEQEKRDAQLEAAKDQLAAQAVKTEGPLYWESLLPELSQQCEDLDVIEIQAKAYSLENQFCPEQKTYQVDMQTKGHWPTDAHATLIYFTGSSEIRVTSNIRKLSEISLYATEHGIRAVSNLDLKQMDVKGLASYLLEGLVEAIDKEKRSGK
jgi:hypothetical protein